MSELYREQYDGMDPGLGDLAFDGTEYELDEFGEKIGGDDAADDMAEDDMVDDLTADDSMVTEAEKSSSDSAVEEGFREAIHPDSNPHIGDQLDDPDLSEAAEADYPEHEA